MRRSTLIAVLVLAAILVAIGVTLSGEGGGALRDWLASLHGTPSH